MKNRQRAKFTLRSIDHKQHFHFLRFRGRARCRLAAAVVTAALFLGVFQAGCAGTDQVQDAPPINASSKYDEGDTLLPASVYAMGIGPVLESDDPNYEYHGKESVVAQEKDDAEYLNNEEGTAAMPLPLSAGTTTIPQRISLRDTSLPTRKTRHL